MSYTKSLLLEHFKTHYYDLIFNKIDEFVKFNKKLVENNCNKLYKRVYNQKLDDYKMMTIYINSIKDDYIYADIIIITVIKFNYVIGKYNDRDQDQLNSVWISLPVKIKLDNKIEILNLYSPMEYIPIKRKENFNNNFMPIIEEKEYDKYAEDILEKYYPEYKDEPVDIEKLAKRMGIIVLDKIINKEKSTLGQIYFKSTQAKFYNLKKNVYYYEKVENNTIVIDTSTINKYSLNSKNVTIAHECIHYYYHRNTFKLYSILNNELNLINCDYNDNNNLKVNDIEIQANIMAPKLIMPKKYFKKVVNEYLEKYKETNAIDRYEGLIKFLSKHYKVTEYAAKKRLLDLNYYFIKGINNFVNGDKVTSYLCNEIRSDETYELSYEDYVNILSKESRMFEYLITGYFIFVDYHICLNDDKYIRRINNELYLTQYAKENIAECCLLFKRKNKYKNNTFLNSNLNRDAKIDLSFEVTLSTNEKLDDIIQKSEKLREFMERENEVLKMIIDLPFNEALDKLIKYMKIERKELVIDSGLSLKTISRYLKNESKPDKRSFAALCIGLKISPKIINVLMQKAEVAYFDNEYDICITDLLFVNRGNNIKVVNEMLIKLKFPPLIDNIK